ncbi:MAG: hydrogenase maturation protease [Nitrospiraceae bacterium]|nr:MAG: hydrogenase maturation protease [Nitrospiraceae bacterium]
MPKILIIGYGNPARCDDGLGPALAAKLEVSSIRGITVESDYQLTVEDAHDVAKHDIVIFADAAIRGKEPFSFHEILPQSPMSFSTHSVSPEAVLSFAQNMFHSRVRAYMLGIRGYEFNRFKERLSEDAERNLEEAFAFIQHLSASGWAALAGRGSND